jgi:peptide/nickel transport system substrate-binding protein
LSTRAFRFRLRRLFRSQKRQVATLSEQADEQFERNFFERLRHLAGVRRFVIGWFLLIVLLVGGIGVQLYHLSGQYQSLRPVAGGTYTEGMVGALSNMNPIYAEGLADRSVSHLVYSGLFALDGDTLKPDLALSWSRDERGREYTVKLRDDARWHDGKPVTADDVVFTYDMIKHPDARSYLHDGWTGVQVKAVDPQTVVFTLQASLVSFPYEMTNGIIPKHIFEGVLPSNLRSSPLNTNALIGSGPFRWRALEVEGVRIENRQEHVLLDANTEYYRGKPKLDSFGVRVFGSEQRLIDSYQRRELQAMIGLDALPESIAGDEQVQLHYLPQTAEMMTFFRTTEGVLADKVVRQALVRGVNTAEVRAQLPYQVEPADRPLLKGQLGFSSAEGQLPYDQAAAKVQLDGAGWVAGEGGIRAKGGAPLSFTLRAEATDDAACVTRSLQQQWRALGADVRVEMQESDEFATTLNSHDYDALLHGISIGPDPDVYVYWHSSQADVFAGSRLNFSEYKSAVADEALSSARSRLDVALRTAKYKPFLEAWRDDAPALALYQTRVLYVTRDSVYGLDTPTVSAASDRFYDVHNWMIRRGMVTND